MSSFLSHNSLTKQEALQRILKFCCQSFDFLNQQPSSSIQNLSDFLEHFFHHVSLDWIHSSLHQDGFEKFTQRILTAWKGIHYRSPEQNSTLTFHDTKDQTILLALNDDQPFLVDTMVLGLKQQGLVGDVMIHPVLNVKRDGQGFLQNILKSNATDPSVVCESFIYVSLSKILNSEQKQILLRILNQAFLRLSNVTNEFPIMHHHLESVAKKYSVQKDQSHAQVADFLKWLGQGHFIYMGYRYQSFKTQKPFQSPCYGLYCDPSFSTEIDQPKMPQNFFSLGRHFKTDQPLLRLLKHPVLSPVVRDLRLETLHILEIGAQDEVLGSHEFLGIFSRTFFTHLPSQIPTFSERYFNILDRFSLSPDWHDGKTIIHILNSLPADEILYFSDEDLFTTCQRLFDQPNRLHLIDRFDSFHQSLTLLIYIPVARYHSDIEKKLTETVLLFLNARLIRCYLLKDDFFFVRLGLVLILRPHSYL